MKYSVPVVWQSWGIVEVEANDVNEAMKLALDAPLPLDASYIDDSMEVDKEGIHTQNQLSNEDIEELR